LRRRKAEHGWRLLPRPLAGFFFYVLCAMVSTAAAADPQGVWLTEGKDAALTITKCGDRLCGKIIWLRNARDRSGSLRLDQKNPDPAQQAQPVCGLVVIRGLKPSGPNTWDGRVYNPEDGKTYSGDVTVLTNNNQLKMRAYLGLPIFGESQTWTRVESLVGSGIEDTCR
jgi:uncharacterized protein (DUF2147 family)